MADKVRQSRPDLSETDVLSAARSVEFDPLGPDLIVHEIKAVADKLIRDQTTRGDLKIILRARNCATPSRCSSRFACGGR